MKEEMQREWVFSVLADRLEEMGDADLSSFFRWLADEPRTGHAVQMLEHLGKARNLTYQEGGTSWWKAAAKFNELELEHQNLIVEDVPNIVDAAIEANEGILEDGIVEIDQRPRIILEAGRYPYGPARLMVSGWFRVNMDGQGQVQPNPIEDEDDYDEDELDVYDPDPPPRWGQLNHEHQMRLLQTVTGFDEESISIQGGDIWGRPYRNYAYAGMKLRWGPLAKALEQARQIGYIAEE
jgi:hypothetical protein